ncbi:MAG: phosphoribosylformylglycinamidine synthase subunit PurQ [Bacteroidia bacterium]
MIKFGVVVFPGSNCDDDTVYVLSQKLKQKVVKLWHKQTDLENCTHLILPGGFSYGDYLRSGAIARFSPIMKSVIEHANKGGFVLGICNGFQILCEAHLLPGALLHNTNRKFICKNVHIKPHNFSNLLTRHLPRNKNAYKIPIAHGEGNYFCDNDTLKSLQDNDQIVFQYCDESGRVTPESNPNGSLLNIAGICNKTKNVFGMMPHPERSADDELRNTDGIHIFQSIIESAFETVI